MTTKERFGDGKSSSELFSNSDAQLEEEAAPFLERLWLARCESGDGLRFFKRRPVLLRSSERFGIGQEIHLEMDGRLSWLGEEGWRGEVFDRIG